MRVRLNLEHIARELASSKSRYVRVKDVSEMLGVSTKTAGKILVRLEREGYVKRYSLRAYKIVFSGERTVEIKPPLSSEERGSRF
ncbi:MAG: hypothetical protein QXS85_00670 [Acidilobaceae archaeon]